MFDETQRTLARGRRMLAAHVTPATYRDRRPLTVGAWRVPGEPVGFEEARQAVKEPFGVGDPWGAPWSTWWFELTGSVPPEFAGHPVEVVIDLGFTSDQPGFAAEGLLYDDAGQPLKGVHPRNRWYRLPAESSGPLRLHLEAAANPSILDFGFAPTALGDPATAGDEPLYRLGRCDLAIFDEEVFALAIDLEVLLDLAEQLPDGDPRRHEILAAVADALTVIDVHDVSGTAAATRARLVPALQAPANASAQRLTATAHAHIDSAWLWPVRETRRKCARTFANVTALAEFYPELVFACSSAQQYAWIRAERPELWRRIEQAVEAGNWVPVGGMWVEPDGVIPSGESFARQLLYGQRFFLEAFGRRCTGMWLPDSFGYSGSYPQIAALAGAQWFLTQKISWNDTNTFPHHTFWWEGIDGTRIFTHFPPADTYNADLRGDDVHRSARGFLEKGRSRKSLIPFGFGDGGGGPEREMLERGRRLADLEGSPRVEFDSPETFFADLRAEYGEHAATWTGELYLELHRGTLTSQRAMKQGNRECETLLRQAEQVWTEVVLAEVGDWPSEQLRQAWETVLLLQFHDILPGSSIAWVHAEARADYDRLRTELGELITDGLRRLGGGRVNSSPFDRREVLPGPSGLQLRSWPALSVGAGVEVTADHPVSTHGSGGATVLSNGLVSVTVEADGTISSLLDHRHDDRQVLPVGARFNELRLHQDVPLLWDAWDLDKPHARAWTSPEAVDSTLIEADPLRACVETRSRVGGSTLVQRLSLEADSPRVNVELDVEWAERDRALAVYFPVSVLAGESTAEIQYGHLRRPAHENTSWEAARFEMVAHRWLHVGETDWGLAVVNTASYGHSVRRSAGVDGEPITTVRLTLLRSPQFPDPHADAGSHRLSFGIVPGATVAEAIEHGYQINLPVQSPSPSDPHGEATDSRGESLIEVDDPGAVIEAVKLAEDGSGDLIVRLYESLGGRRRVSLRPRLQGWTVEEVDLLEEPETPALDGRRSLAAVEEGRVSLLLMPFQLVTLRFARTT